MPTPRRRLLRIAVLVRALARDRIGLHEFDAKLENLSRPRIVAQIAELKGLQARLTAIDRGRLSFDETIDAQLIENAVNAALLDLTVVRGWERNPMVYAGLPGNALDSLMKRDFAPPAERLRSVIARLSQVPTVYAAAKQNLTTPAKELTDVALRMARGSVGFLDGAVRQWAQPAAGNDAALLAQFEQAHGPALAAARDFAEWLQRDLAPRSRAAAAHRRGDVPRQAAVRGDGDAAAAAVARAGQSASRRTTPLS
jgi:uncharacterized protein (DUF885 family)